MTAAGAPIADPKRAFLEYLPVIERVIGIIVRRHALSSTDADDFGSWARTKIIDSDYAPFRRFAGRSSMSTYLSVVLGNLFLDYRNSVWGRWRPSVAATRMGPIGVRLEEMLHRDGYSLREAIEVLRSAGAEQSVGELRRMAARMPFRQSATEVPLDAIDGTAHEADTTSSVSNDEHGGLVLLRSALLELPADDQLLLRMRFWEDFSVADISRALQVEQKPLYRRIEAIESRLRTLLTERGVDRERVRALLSGDVAW
jgi:RNA polymerase sigma factor (sigma-70 family)